MPEVLRFSEMFVYLQTRCATELVEAGLRSGFSPAETPLRIARIPFSDRTKVFGLMAEWLGKGLQNLVQRFESASDLTETVLQISVTLFSFWFVIHLSYMWISRLRKSVESSALRYASESILLFFDKHRA